MERVSKEFKEAIYASARQITAKIAFEIVDPTAYYDVSIVPLTSEASISRANQIVDKERAISYKYATFERDYFKLDGSFRLPPEPIQADYELGFWSEGLCDEFGVFAIQPQVKINFTEPHNSIGLTIAFDTTSNEYASNFTIIISDLSNVVIHTENVVDNDSPLYTLDRNLENYGSIQINIEKWATGYRRARIAEIDFGLIKEYEGTDLINLNVIEEMDLIGNTVPSNEINFTLDNQERLFNILNPEGIYEFLMLQQKVSAYMGLKIGEGENDYEFVSIGKYYLTDWQTDEGALTTTFTARDIFDSLEIIEYNTLTPNTSLYDLAVDILNKANIDDFSIDESLNFINTNGFVEPISSRIALQNVAIAGRAVIYQDRQGKLNIRRIEPLTISTGYVTFPSPDTFVGLVTPEITNDYAFQAIDFDNVFAEPQVSLNEIVSSLTFVVNDGTENGTEAIFANPLVIKGGVPYKIDNKLINTIVHAESVAEWMFQEYNMKASYKANWRQNPALTCGDAILVEDSFGQRKKSRITRQEFRFEGFLTGMTESTGGV